MQALPFAFHALAAYRQFIVYKLAPSQTTPGKTDKLPIDYRTGLMPLKNSGASSVWTDYQSAIGAAARLGEQYGVGFSFAETDPFWFLDIDNCLEPSGEWSALAKSLLAAFPGAAVEVSQSGRGLHIIGTGTMPPHGCKNIPLGLELYHTDRFVALTGAHAMGNAGTDFSYCLPWLVEHYFPAPMDNYAMTVWADEPVEEWCGPEDDKQLIDRAMRSKSAAGAFGNRASFADLWTGDERALSAAYPHEERAFDASSADAALAQHLAFWTGKNCERIRRLMQQSALVRDKWERDDYLPMTITKACSRQIDVLQDKPILALTIELDKDGEVTAAPSVMTSATYLDIPQQMEFFKGCVYVQDLHRVLIPGGALLKPEQFRTTYGGFTFPMDPGNERMTRNAWECFTESQAFRAPRADSTCFRPDLEPGTIIVKDEQKLVNTWWAVQTPQREGDVAPFLLHLAKILPNMRDQQIMLSYMAACVQHPGIKFQWAPLLQGVEGNGKTLFTRCVAFAIGNRYSHFPKASQIAKHFNGWMEGKLFIGVEDIYVPESQREVLEELKPMITGERLEIERKGVDQITRDVCCNFMLNSNHKDAIRKTKNDRRFAPFYTAQQNVEDLQRDGMKGEYFPNLYSWLKDGGYEAVNYFLHTYVIADEFNPSHGHIAPLTSSTKEALSFGLGRVEQEIIEAIEREESGFRGGWVSSMAVDKLLEKIGAARAIPPNKRRDLLINIGYDWHPNLASGRVNNMVLPDGGKPRLFIKLDSELRHLPNPAEIARTYSAAQI